MQGPVLEFERPILELEKKIEDLQNFSKDKEIDLSLEINKLEARLDKLKKDVFCNLSAWQKVQLARHPKRPYTLDYIDMIFSDFIEFHGDGFYADDKSMISGIGIIDGHNVAIIGHQKGRDTKENLIRNFGSSHPEGYRKALKIMKLAEKFNLPIIVFIDTPGAYPGIGAEERGQAHSIAHNMREMTNIKVPIIIFVIGEGGSGGALGVGVGDRVYSLENSYYSVISPEGCAAILWRDKSKADLAAETLKLTASDLLELKIIDGIVKEPLGGAHRDPKETAKNIKKYIEKDLKSLSKKNVDEIIQERYNKFRKIGKFLENNSKAKSN